MAHYFSNDCLYMWYDKDEEPQWKRMREISQNLYQLFGEAGGLEYDYTGYRTEGALVWSDSPILIWTKQKTCFEKGFRYYWRNDRSTVFFRTKEDFVLAKLCVDFNVS